MIFYKYFYKYLMAALKRLSGIGPISVNYIITGRCNGRCIYCNPKSGKELPTKQAFDLIRKLRKKGTEKITFIGGEPLVRDDIVNILKFSKSLGISTVISTNCLNIPRLIDASHYIDLLILCIDGPKNVHDLLRGNGSYDKQIEALKIINKPKIVNFIVNQKNKCHINHVAELSRIFGFFINVQPVINHGLADADVANLKLEAAELKEFFNNVLKLKAAGIKFINSYAYLHQMASFGKYHGKCYAGKYSAVVKPNGEIAKCYASLRKDNDTALCSCENCEYTCHIEESRLFGFKPDSISNLMRLNRW